MRQFGGPWTLEKLDILESYLAAYTTALHDKFELYYIDAFAGSGSCRFKHKAPTLPFGMDSDAVQSFYDGSVRIALKTNPPFNRYIFIETNQECRNQLEKTFTEFPQLSDRIALFSGDANKILLNISRIQWRKRRCRGVVFLDPYSMEVSWKTLEAIAATQAMDLWFLFPIGAVNRLLERSGNISDSWKNKLNDVFGCRDWQKRFYTSDSPQMSLIEHHHKITKTANIDTIKDYILERLSSTFAGVAPNPKLLYNSKNSPIFLFCFAIGNPDPKATGLALKLARYILGKHG